MVGGEGGDAGNFPAYAASENVEFGTAIDKRRKEKCVAPFEEEEEERMG